MTVNGASVAPTATATNRYAYKFFLPLCEAFFNFGAQNMNIADSHIHIGLNKFGTSNFPYNLENDFHEYMEVFKSAKYSKAVILPIPYENFDAIRSNDYLEQAFCDSDGKFLPICRLDNALANRICGNFFGLKIHRVYADVSLKQLRIPLKILEYYKSPLIIHAKFKDKVKQIREILEIAPNLKIVLAHMGRESIYTAEGVLKNVSWLADAKNVYFETSTVGDVDALKKACDMAGSSRIMFGSDYPFGKIHFGKNYRYTDDLDLVLNAPISELHKKDILYSTAMNVFQAQKKRRDSFVTQYQSIYKDDMIDLLANLNKQERIFLALDKKLSVIKNCMRNQNHIFVIVGNGKFAGFMRESNRENNSSLLEEIVILPAYRGLGLARMAIKFYKHLFPKSYAKSNVKNSAINHILETEGYIRDEGKRIFHWQSEKR